MTLELRSRGQTRPDRISAISVWGRIRYFVVAAGATLEARRMLARVVGPYKSRGSPHIPPHLLRDIGLPDYSGDSGRNYWDHQ